MGLKRILDFPGKRDDLFGGISADERHAHLTLFPCSPYAQRVAHLDAHLLPTRFPGKRLFATVRPVACLEKKSRSEPFCAFSQISIFLLILTHPGNITVNLSPKNVRRYAGLVGMCCRICAIQDLALGIRISQRTHRER
jgi:hypothetical protein